MQHVEQPMLIACDCWFLTCFFLSTLRQNRQLLAPRKQTNSILLMKSCVSTGGRGGVKPWICYLYEIFQTLQLRNYWFERKVSRPTTNEFLNQHSWEALTSAKPWHLRESYAIGLLAHSDKVILPSYDK
jgi:hypothetical protein